jgi:hypothetical protein
MRDPVPGLYRASVSNTNPQPLHVGRRGAVADRSALGNNGTRQRYIDLDRIVI